MSKQTGWSEVDQVKQRKGGWSTPVQETSEFTPAQKQIMNKSQNLRLPKPPPLSLESISQQLADQIKLINDLRQEVAELKTIISYTSG